MLTAYTLGYDSTQISLIPAGALVIFAYRDGRYANETAARERFPKAYIVPLTTQGGWAEGIDWEPGDVETDPVIWLTTDAEGYRPVFYADLSDMTGTILPRLAVHFGTIPPPGPERPYRILTAHPNGIEHVCGPSTCGQLDVDADGTQYLWDPRGVNIDISALLPSFIAAPTPTPPTPPEDTTMIATYLTADERIGFVVEVASGEVLHIEQQNAPGKGDSDFWRNANGTANWLTLGTPGS